VQINKKLYQVINRIGKGGFSEVFCCFSFEDKKTYALKKSDLNNLDEDNRKLVFRETDTLKGLQNTDKVVKFIDQ
jgi:serine/threonine protein kinase